MTTESHVTSIIDKLDAIVADGPVPARRLLDAFGAVALAPTLVVPALMAVSPLSAIPLFSSFCGLAMFLIAVQGAFGRTQPWLPGFIQNRALPAERTRRAAHALRYPAAWLDWATRPRLVFLVSAPMNRVLYLLCALAAAFIPLLELVPMSATTIGAGVSLVAIGILARDGILALCGVGIFCLAATLPWLLVTRLAAVFA